MKTYNTMKKNKSKSKNQTENFKDLIRIATSFLLPIVALELAYFAYMHNYRDPSITDITRPFQIEQRSYGTQSRVKSYYDSICPTQLRFNRFGEALLRTDLDNDGSFDLDEIYVEMSPNTPIEVNVKKGYEKFLEDKVANLEKINRLKERRAFKIREPSYFVRDSSYFQHHF